MMYPFEVLLVLALLVGGTVLWAIVVDRRPKSVWINP